MRFVLGVLSLALVVIGAACSAEGGGTGGKLDGVVWVLQSYDKGGSPTDVPSGSYADAAFAEGKIGGSSGCNAFSASATVDGARLTIGPVATTKKLCDQGANDLEHAYLDALARAVSYTATADSLSIFDAGGRTPVLVYGARQPGAVSSGTWHATAIDDGAGGLASVVAGTDPTTTFGSDGMVSGNAGCNTYSASYVLSGETIAIEPVASTQMACPAPIMTQEAAFLKALTASRRAVVRGPRLELQDAGGAVQISFELR